MTEPNWRHDCKWTQEVIEWIASDMPQGGYLLDPMAGGGFGVEEAFGSESWRLVGLELEPEWAACRSWIRVGNALDIDSYPIDDITYAGIRIFCSIDYGNRMSGDFLGSPCRECKGRSVDWRRKKCRVCGNTGSDAGRRQGYAISLGRKLTDGNMAKRGWGGDWRTDHVKLFHIWSQILDGGERTLYLNVKDFHRSVRKTVQDKRVSVQELVRVSDWCIEVLTGMGFTLVERKRIKTPSYAEGQNREAREPNEQVLVFDY